MPPNSFFKKPFLWLNRLWLQLNYAQPLRLVASRWRRHDQYLAWFNSVATPVLRPPAAAWVACERSPSMVGPQVFQFAGTERVLSDNRGWHWKPWGEDWLHNLHAFDDLTAGGAVARRDWHQKLITNWMVANPPGKGIGWKPQSLSRRTVNWIKWELGGGSLNEIARRNLVVQVRYLRQHLGTSIVSAYPCKAGKALVFAGAFFQGSEADAWRRTGNSLLGNALRPAVLEEQLTGAGIVATSMVEDLLDLVQLAAIYPGLFDPGAASKWALQAAQLLEREAASGTVRLQPSQPQFFPGAAPVALQQYGRSLGLKNF